MRNQACKDKPKAPTSKAVTDVNGPSSIVLKRNVWFGTTDILNQI